MYETHLFIFINSHQIIRNCSSLLLMQFYTQTLTDTENVFRLQPGNWPIAVVVSDQILSVGQSRNAPDDTERDSNILQTHSSLHCDVTMSLSNCFCVFWKIRAYKGFIIVRMLGHFLASHFNLLRPSCNPTIFMSF